MDMTVPVVRQLAVLASGYIFQTSVGQFYEYFVTIFAVFLSFLIAINFFTLITFGNALICRHYMLAILNCIFWNIYNNINV